MPRAEKQDITEARKNNRPGHSPYNQSGRKPKTRTSSWTPSIWSALTFWKSRDASHKDEEDREEEYDGDVSTDYNEVSNLLTLEDTMDTMDTTGEDAVHHMSPPNVNILSKEDIAFLTQSPRDVPFHQPNGDHGLLNHSSSRLGSEPPVSTPQRDAYVAPLPPSSPLSPSEDPLAKVSDYIDNVLRPRGGECTDVEAIGLSMLIQSSVNYSGTHHGTPPNLNPFLLPRTNPRPSSVSSLSPVPPMFTSRDTDINAIIASSSGPSNSSHIMPISNVSAHSTPSPGRTLAQNPNGPLYYQGGGSARSRQRSPAFGSTGRRKVPSSSPFEGKGDAPKVNGMAEMPSPSDGKRRRVGEERESSVAQASGPHVGTPNGTSTRPRTPAVSSSIISFGASTAASRFLASTPARPSPLRQSMRADSSSPGSASSGSVNGDSPMPKTLNSDGEQRSNVSEKASEKASEIMAGIIKDATKDSVPDVRNPYQPTSQSPTKRTRKGPAKVPRPLPRPTRQPANSPSALPLKKLSALETIQSTAPQTGSKRSHTGMPPPAPPSVNSNSSRTVACQMGSSADKPVVIDLDEDEPQGPPTKKHKSEQSPLPKPSETQMNVHVEEVNRAAITSDKVSRPTEVIELDNGTETKQTQSMQPQQQQDMKRPMFAGPFMRSAATTRFQTAPKEPSPLRQSFQPDMPPSPPADSISVEKTIAPSASSTSLSTCGPSPSASTSTPTTSAPTSLAPSPFAPTSAAPPFGSTFGSSTSGSTSGSSPFGSTPVPSLLAQKSTTFTFGSTSPSAPTSASSPFGSTFGPSPLIQKSTPSPLGSTSGPSPFGSISTPSSEQKSDVTSLGSTSSPSTFGSTSNPSPFGSTSGPSAFGSTFNPSPFGSTSGTSAFGLTSNPSPFGSTSGPSAFGSTSNPSPFGSTSGPSAFGSTSNPSPFGSTSGTSAFGSISNPSPFGSTSGTSAFGSTSNPSPFGSTSGTSAFGSTSGPSAFTQKPGPSAFGSTSNPSPFAQKSDSSSFTSTPTSAVVPVMPSSPFGSTVSTPSPFGSAVSILSPFSSKSAPAPSSIPPAAAAAPAEEVTSTPTTDAVPASVPSAITTNTDTDLVALAKQQMLHLPVSELPTFAFSFTTKMSPLPEYVDQRDAALAVPTSELPTYNFEVKHASSPVPTATSAPVLKAEVKPFDWAAAGMTVPKRTGWTCGLCSCQNAEGTPKCSVCGEVPAPAPKAEVKAFDWTAAGMKAPSRTGWTCVLCSCQNTDGSSKCSVCGENKP